jgi:tRNA(Arg) A34 adenosine deaminase TadA
MAADPTFIELAIDLAMRNVETGAGGPFGAVVVKDGQVIATGANSVTATNDPTAHAEVVAIRNACKALGSFQLDGCEIYTSCEPCPMCLGALYWARPSVVYYANTRTHAAEAGFDDAFIYDEVAFEPERRSLRMVRLEHDRAPEHFNAWIAVESRVKY